MWPEETYYKNATLSIHLKNNLNHLNHLRSDLTEAAKIFAMSPCKLVHSGNLSGSTIYPEGVLWGVPEPSRRFPNKLSPILWYMNIWVNRDTILYTGVLIDNIIETLPEIAVRQYSKKKARVSKGNTRISYPQSGGKAAIRHYAWEHHNMTNHNKWSERIRTLHPFFHKIHHGSPRRMSFHSLQSQILIGETKSG